MSNLPHITESEWLVMSQLWNQSPLTAAEIVKLVNIEKELAATTVKTLLRRLISKQAVRYTIDKDNAKLYYYYPIVTEEECVLEKSKHFLSAYFRNNLEKMVTTFVDGSDLTTNEIDSLKELLDKKKQAKFHREENIDDNNA